MAGRLKNNLIYFAARLSIKLFNIMPRKLARFLGETLGLTSYTCLKMERHKTLTNLDRAFGDELSIRRKKEIARGCFITFGRAITEAMRIPRYYHTQIRPDIEVIGEENLRNAYERGRGVVVFTGHIGNFELLAAHCAQSKYKTAVIGRELYDQRLDRMLISNRQSMGIVNIRSDASPKTVLRYLKEGYVIGILIDTDSFRVGGELTPFFGRPAKTPTGPTQLGLISDAAFLPVFCLSFPGGKYKIIMGDEFVPESRIRTRENIYRITCRMTNIIENLIRSYPEQWIWMHNRWHTRPEDDDREFLESIGITL